MPERREPATLSEAVRLHQSGRFEDAARMYRAVLAADPGNGDALHLLGLIDHRHGRFEEAERRIRAALAVRRQPEYLSSLGMALKAQGRPEEAVAAYRAALELRPDYPEAHNNLGNALKELGRAGEALPHFRIAIERQPELLQIRVNLADALKVLGRPEEAADALRGLLARKPDDAETFNELGRLWKDLARPEKATAAFHRTAALVPGRSGPYHNLGFVLAEQDRYRDAAGAYRRAARLDPGFAETRLNLGLALLYLGELDQGWEEYEWRMRGGSKDWLDRHFPQPAWDGSHLGGRRLYLWSEQGVGDVVMFASCLPDLAGLGGPVTLECPPKLQPLFRRSFPWIALVTPGERPDAELEGFDLQLPVGSLPRLFRRRLADFPETAFLVPDPERVAHWRRRLEALGPGPYVGLSWRGRLRTGWRDLLYTRIEEWEPVLRTPGVTFVDMQYDDAAEELAQVRESFGVEIHSFPDIDKWDDLDEVTALAGALDLLIGVDTAVYTLAAGAGTPTWLLWLEKLEEWYRVGTDRLPWYPRVLRLFPRSRREPWTVALKRIAEDLRERVSGAFSSGA